MFCNLTEESLTDFDAIGIMMSHARGAKLFSEGDAARNVFILCFGQVKISSTSRDGKTMILKIAVPGDVMGLSAVLANVPHEVTAEAIEPCQVKTVRKQEFCGFFWGATAWPACTRRSPPRSPANTSPCFTTQNGWRCQALRPGRLARLLLDWGRSAANGKPRFASRWH